MLDPPWDVVSTRTSGGLLGNNKELFRGEALRMAEGGVRVEDGENHLCKEDNGGVGGLVGRWQGILISLAGVEGLFVLMGAYGPTGPSTLSLQLWKVTYAKAWTHNPHLETLPLWVLCLFGCCFVTVLSRSHDLIIVDCLLSCLLSRQREGTRDMSSSETTRILFNSPALHSLKRDQLVKLCKLHSIKATGKNTELVEKLKRHAGTLPLASPLSVATRSEQPQHDANSPPQRPSEQWEIVMDDIPDVPGGISMLTGDAPDEFGTGGGSKRDSFPILAIF
jgi:hypothetical protein